MRFNDTIQISNRLLNKHLKLHQTNLAKYFLCT